MGCFFNGWKYAKIIVDYAYFAISGIFPIESVSSGQSPNPTPIKKIHSAGSLTERLSGACRFQAAWNSWDLEISGFQSGIPRLESRRP